MKINIISLFPSMFDGVFNESIIGRAQRNGIVSVKHHNLRDFAGNKNRIVDDKPFGGGAGMLIKPEPVYKAIEFITKKKKNKPKVILMTPQGVIFNQQAAKRLSKEKHLVFVCGHYEGFDERVSKIIDEEISIGEYVLTGGEIPAMAVIDAIVRLIPGVVKETQSVVRDSFYDHLLDYPSYTRPRIFRKMKVPDVLLSGNHKQIELWRFKQMLKRTIEKMPHLLQKRKWTEEEKVILEEVKKELPKLYKREKKQ